MSIKTKKNLDTVFNILLWLYLMFCLFNTVKTLLTGNDIKLPIQAQKADRIIILFFSLCALNVLTLFFIDYLKGGKFSLIKILHLCSRCITYVIFEICLVFMTYSNMNYLYCFFVLLALYIGCFVIQHIPTKEKASIHKTDLVIGYTRHGKY